MEKALEKSPDKSLYVKLLASLKLRAVEEDTKGTWFVPSDRVSVTAGKAHLAGSWCPPPCRPQIPPIPPNLPQLVRCALTASAAAALAPVSPPLHHNHHTPLTTTQAINAFLKEMGLTADELLARPQLVDAILSYHFIPGVTLKDFSNPDITTNANEPSILKTGVCDYVGCVDGWGWGWATVCVHLSRCCCCWWCVLLMPPPLLLLLLSIPVPLSLPLSNR